MSDFPDPPEASSTASKSTAFVDALQRAKEVSCFVYNGIVEEDQH
jgi:hypothetical protein